MNSVRGQQKTMKKIIFAILFSSISFSYGSRTFEDQPSALESFKEAAHDAKRTVQRAGSQVLQDITSASTDFVQRAKRGFKMTEDEFDEAKALTVTIKKLSDHIKSEAKTIDEQVAIFQEAIQKEEFTKAAQIQTRLIASWQAIKELVEISSKLELLLKNISTVLPSKQADEVAALGDNLRALAEQTDMLVQQSSTALSELQSSLQSCGTWQYSLWSVEKQEPEVAQGVSQATPVSETRKNSPEKTTGGLQRLMKGFKMSPEAFGAVKKINEDMQKLTSEIEPALKKNESNIAKFKEAMKDNKYDEVAKLSSNDLGAWEHIEKFIKIIGRIGAVIAQISVIFPEDQQSVLKELSAILKTLKEDAEDLVSKSYAILNGAQRSLSACSASMQRLSIGGEAIKAVPRASVYKKPGKTKN